MATARSEQVRNRDVTITYGGDVQEACRSIAVLRRGNEDDILMFPPGWENMTAEERAAFPPIVIPGGIDAKDTGAFIARQLCVRLEIAVAMATDRVSAIPRSDLRRLVGELNIFLATAAAQLSGGEPEKAAPVAEPDELLDVHQAAVIAKHSASWMHHHGQKLPGFWQSGEKGTRKGWYRRPLEEWSKQGAR